MIIDLNNLKNKIFENITIKKVDDTKKLFERMGYIGQMPIHEETVNSLPPGFSNADFEPLEAGVCGGTNENVDEASDMNPTVVGGSDVKLNKILKDRASGIKNKKSDPILHNTTIKGIIDDEGNDVDPEKLKQLLMIKPPVILNQNGKMGKSDVYSITLPKYRGIFYDEKENKLKIVNTCPNAKDCVLSCYAGKGGYVMYPRSSEKSAQILNYLLNHWNEWKTQLLNEIKSHEYRNEEMGVETVIRWHDSGDFLSEKYLDLAITIAKETPNVIHYAYTKEVELTQGKTFPENFIIRHSIGGIEDKLIDRTKRHADIISKEDYQPYIKKIKVGEDIYYKYINNESIQGLKNFLAKKHNLDVNSILTFKELMEKEKTNEPYWNVVVTPSNGDNAAYRKDVLGVFLLFH